MSTHPLSPLAIAGEALIPRPTTVRSVAAGTSSAVDSRIEPDYFSVPSGFVEALHSYRLEDTPPEPIRTIVAAGEASPESYRIEIGADEITVSASASAGVLYAIQTLRQLVLLGNPAMIPCGFIEDSPALKVRGLMIDVSRNRVPTRETLLGYLDLMLLMKMNQFQLYTEHTFAYRDHEDVWRDWSPITGEDILWLDREARSRNIELVPNQNSFGHLNHWLSLPRYSHLAEAPDGFVSPWGRRFSHPFSLSPSVPETRDFLGSLYDELLPFFSSSTLNVGCDETFDLGQGRSSAECETRGTGEVYLEFLQDIHRIVSVRGKRMMFYADILKNHPEVIDRVPKNAIAVEWWYEAENDFDLHCRRLSSSGLDFIVAPGTSSWNSITGRYANAAGNVRAAVSAALDHGALGILMTDWGDNGHLQSFPIALPAIALAAGLSWNPQLSDEEPFRFLSALPVWAGGFGDESLGEALKILEGISDRIGPGAHNSSLFGLSLVNFEVDEYFRILTTHTFDESWVRTTLAEVRSLAAGDRPARDDSSVSGGTGLLRDEIILAVDMALFALDLIPLHRAGAADGFAAEINVLISRARELETEFRRQWLMRFRPGGLTESVASLWKALRSFSPLALVKGVGDTGQSPQ